MKILYTVSILAGLGSVVYFYGITFDDLSETELITLIPYWFLPLIFGIYGFVAEKLNTMVSEGKAVSTTTATFVLCRMFGFLGLLGFIPLFPLFFVKGKNSFIIALFGTLVWSVLMALFIFAIFPML